MTVSQELPRSQGKTVGEAKQGSSEFSIPTSTRQFCFDLLLILS